MKLYAAIVPVFALFVAALGCQTEVVNDSDPLSGDPQHMVKCNVAHRSCEGDYGEQGDQFCVQNSEGEEFWTECCVNTEGLPCMCDAPWVVRTSYEECNTPLVLAFEGEAVAYTAEMAGSFDLTGVGMSAATDWPTAATPWLALDRDGNGSIDSGAELFGSATMLGSGKPAANGFLALGELDDNGDGLIDRRDAAFSRLVVWRDEDASRTSSAAELSPASASIEAIEVGYSVAPRCDERGNCEVERAAFRYTDASGRPRSGSVIDVHLKRR